MPFEKEQQKLVLVCCLWLKWYALLKRAAKACDVCGLGSNACESGHFIMISWHIYCVMA
jgi:hypothetical protein